MSAQNVILPDAYPEKYKREKVDEVEVFEVPFFGGPPPGEAGA